MHAVADLRVGPVAGEVDRFDGCAAKRANSKRYEGLSSRLRGETYPRE